MKFCLFKTQMSRKIMAIFLVLVMMTMLGMQMIYAASTWTDCATWSLSAGGGYSTTTTTGAKLGATKTTNDSSWTVYTVSKTMNTRPKAKLVNSAGETRSDIVTTAAAGKSVSGSANTGTIGYAEYLAVKPATAQVGVHTIKLQFKNY